MSQTIAGYAVAFLDDGMFSPDWTRQPVIQTLTLSGTGITEDHLLGYGPWTLTATIQVTGNDDDALAHRALRALTGRQVLVGGWTDPTGAAPFNARLAAYNVRPIAGGAGGYEGTIELRQSGVS